MTSCGATHPRYPNEPCTLEEGHELGVHEHRCPPFAQQIRPGAYSITLRWREVPEDPAVRCALRHACGCVGACWIPRAVRLQEGIKCAGLLGSDIAPGATG